MIPDFDPAPLNHAKATAKVSVTGLALSCFNPKTRNWEVGLIREPEHALRILVKRFSPETGEGTTSTFEIGANHRISITAVKAVKQAQPLFKQDPFDRRDPERSHPEDIRWIVDFETEFNNRKPVQLSRPTSEVTQLYVAEPLLYADADHKRADLKLLDLKTNAESPFGTLGETCNADITCSEGGKVTLSVVGPKGFSMEFPHIPGKTHVIRIENECSQDLSLSEDPKPTDFSIYFPLLNLPGSARFDVRENEGQHGTDAVCNPSFMSVRTSLFPF